MQHLPNKAAAVAATQGWNEETTLILLCGFIAREGLADRLDSYFARVAAEENNEPAPAQSDAEHVRRAIAALRSARDSLVAAEAPRAADKVRRALKSAEGAARNVAVRQWRTESTPADGGAS